MQEKKCTDCEIVKPLDEFFYRNDNNKYREKCKLCHNKKRKVEWSKGTIFPCEYCGKSFQKNSWNHKYCSNACNSNTHNHRTGKSKTKWTPDLIKKCDKCAKEFHPPKNAPFKDFCSQRCSDRHRQPIWLAKNPGKQKEYDRRNYEKYPEKNKKRNRAYGKTEKGREVKLKLTRKRRADLNKINESFTNEEWKKKLGQTNGFCPGCKKFIGVKNLQLDHIYPLKHAVKDFKQSGKKREYTINDIQPLCKNCNARKSASKISSPVNT